MSNRATNPNGFKLYPKPIGIAWVIDAEATEGERLRLISPSLYDGSRGGNVGLGYNLKLKAEETDNEPGSDTFGENIHGDITNPEKGRLIKIERAKSDKAEYASYTAGIGKTDAPLDSYLDKLTDEEHDLLEALENIVYIPTEEEIHCILKNYIGEEIYNQIFPMED